MSLAAAATRRGEALRCIPPPGACAPARGR
jgi:hypothetical protein